MPNPSQDRSAWFNVSGFVDPSIRVGTADMVSRTVVTVNVGEMLHVQLSPEVAGDLYRALGDVLAELTAGPVVGAEVHPSGHALAVVAG